VVMWESFAVRRIRRLVVAMVTCGLRVVFEMGFPLLRRRHFRYAPRVMFSIELAGTPGHGLLFGSPPWLWVLREESEANSLTVGSTMRSRFLHDCLW
jgi:hypothetical protein